MEQTLKGRPAGVAGGFKNSNFAQAWLILVLALIFGAALAAVQVNLSQTIKNNKLKETLERIPELVWGAAKAGEMGSRNPAVDIIHTIADRAADANNPRAFSLHGSHFQKTL